MLAHRQRSVLVHVDHGPEHLELVLVEDLDPNLVQRLPELVRVDHAVLVQVPRLEQVHDIRDVDVQDSPEVPPQSVAGRGQALGDLRDPLHRGIRVHFLARHHRARPCLPAGHVHRASALLAARCKRVKLKANEGRNPRACESSQL
eukprot:scaffold86023_cov63-Phaeocystis_antarctica.AAC.2